MTEQRPEANLPRRVRAEPPDLAQPAGSGAPDAARTSPPPHEFPRRGEFGLPSGGERGLPGRGEPALPRRGEPALPGRGDAGQQNLPRRTGRSRRAGRHRSLHRISVASDAPQLILAVPGAASDQVQTLVERIAGSVADSCPGVNITVGYLSGTSQTLSQALAGLSDAMRQAAVGNGNGNGAGHLGNGAKPAPTAVVVPLLAGPHPVFDGQIESVISRAHAPVMLGDHLGPHPLLAGALHDRLSEVGQARASRARGLNIASGANGVLVVADRGPQAVIDAGVTTVLLASRLAVPAAPASIDDPVSVNAALARLREAGGTHPAISPCVIGPEADAAEFDRLSAILDAPCAEPLGAHPAVAQLVSVRYGEALSRIAVASH